MARTLPTRKNFALNVPTPRRVMRLLWMWIQLARERRALERLENRLLDDIGLDHERRDALVRARWSAPDHWRR